MRHLRRHSDALAQRRVRVNRLADVYRVCAHLNGQRNLANHVARVRTDHAAAQDLAVARASGESSNSSLVTPSSRPLAMARPDAA